MLTGLSLANRVQARLVAIFGLHVQPRVNVSLGEVVRSGAWSRRLMSEHQWVTPHVPYCLHSGWGPKGPRKIRWMSSPCPGLVGLRPLVSKGHQRVFQGQVQISGTLVHASHSLVAFRGFFICTSCGYSAGTKVVKLVEPCLGQMDPSRRSLLRKVEKGDLPYGRKKWPLPLPPPSPSFS